MTLPEEKKEDVIEKEETVKEVIKDQEPEEVKEEPQGRRTKQETKEEDTKLEDYSKGVQSELPNLLVRCGKRKDKEILQPNMLKR